MPPILNSPVALYFPEGGIVTARGVAGARDTVRVLLNPIIPKGMSDDQIFENFATIEALDKKELENAGEFSVDLSVGTRDQPSTVIIATSAGKVARPRIQATGGLSEVLDEPAVAYLPGGGTLKVTGIAAPTATVRVLLNPDLTGVPDNQIFARFAEIPALDKKEKQNAGNFTIFLDTHGVGPPHRVVIVTSDGDVARPLVPPLPQPGGPSG